MVCPYCGMKNYDSGKVCRSCGEALDTVVVPSVNTLVASGKRSSTGNLAFQNGRYVVKKHLGRDNRSATFLAVDRRLASKQVVIKELISKQTNTDKLQADFFSFKEEASRFAQLHHPLLVRLLDHFPEGQSYILVMEYVDGVNLEERLSLTAQPLEEVDVLRYASALLDVLAYLSLQLPPFIHNDIKPSNIIIANKDRLPYLVDIDLQYAPHTPLQSSRRRSSMITGTQGYIAPEVYHQGKIDLRSDLYALAASMHHLLTMRDPRISAPFLFPAVRSLNPEVSSSVERILSRALLQNPAQRYQTVHQMKRDVDAVLLEQYGIVVSIESPSKESLKALSVPLTPYSGRLLNDSKSELKMTAPLLPSFQSQKENEGGKTSVDLPRLPLSGEISRSVQMKPKRTGALTSGRIRLVREDQVEMALKETAPVPVVTTTASVSSGKQKRRVSYRSASSSPFGTKGLAIILFLLLVLLLLVGLTGYYALLPSMVSQTARPDEGRTAIGIQQAANGERIGVSDGSYAFDTQRPGGPFKLQAAEKFRNGDVASADSLWQHAATVDSSDAETLIYLENQRVIESGSPYLTFVVGTMLTGDSSSINVGHSNLQGAYVAQKEFNDGKLLPRGLKVRLLVANTGSNKDFVIPVAQQIVRLAKSDKTVVGVMGWSQSAQALNALAVLGPARIPMLSTAGGDSLTGRSPYFFRVAAPAAVQAHVAAQYAEFTLHARRAAVFIDVANDYSRSLSTDFVKSFTADGNVVVATENYTVGNAKNLPRLLGDALSKHPDVIYFGGYPKDVSAILPLLKEDDPVVMGGNAFYELGGYSKEALKGFSHIRFTALAYPDEWDILSLTANKPDFFTDYARAFDPEGRHQGNPYGFQRADSATVLSYDATKALLFASIEAVQHKGVTISGPDLQKALSNVTVSKSFQGVSGQVSFKGDGDPEDKAVTVVCVAKGNVLRMDTVQGRFLVNEAARNMYPSTSMCN